MSTVMLPEITGKTEHSSCGERRVLETYNGGTMSMWLLRLTRYRHEDNKECGRDVMALYSSELDELCRWWGEVRKATT